MSAPVSRFNQLQMEIQNNIPYSGAINNNWFGESSLRSKIYEYVKATFDYEVNNKKTVQVIWRVCVYTAPIVITMIASEESYKSNEEAFFKVGLLKNEKDIDDVKGIKKGLELFQGSVEKSLENNQRRAFLCNLYGGSHAFVVEKRSDEMCTIFQSYLTFGNDGYAFPDFLNDKNKHREWNTQKLTRMLNKILSKEVSLKKRHRNYEKLFYCKVNLAHMDQDNSIPFVFVESNPYY